MKKIIKKISGSTSLDQTILKLKIETALVHPDTPDPRTPTKEDILRVISSFLGESE